MVRWLAAAILLLSVQPLPAEELKKETVQAWDRYVGWAGAKVRRELSESVLSSIRTHAKN